MVQGPGLVQEMQAKLLRSFVSRPCGQSLIPFLLASAYGNRYGDPLQQLYPSWYSKQFNSSKEAALAQTYEIFWPFVVALCSFLDVPGTLPVLYNGLFSSDTFTS